MSQQKEKKFSIYKIKDGDTLESIANYFEKTQQEIKGFHNIFCDEGSFINVDFPEDLQQLYVYPYLHYKAIGIAEHLDQNTYLKQNEQKRTCNYSVQYTATEAEEKTVIEFDISLSHQGIINNLHLYSINKISEIIINGESAPNDTEEIKEKLLDIVYPLQVLVQESGKWQELVYDHNIKGRFDTAKNEIIEFYKGQTTYDLLNYAEKMVCNEVNFKNIFENNWLLDVLFSDIFMHYNYGQPIKNTLQFGLLNHAAPISFDVEQDISDFVIDSKQVVINRIGFLNDLKNRAQLEETVGETNFIDLGQKAIGRLNQKITLDMASFNLDSIYLTMSIDLQTSRSLQVKINRI